MDRLKNVVEMPTGDWTTCVECTERWMPEHLVAGVCQDCRAKHVAAAHEAEVLEQVPMVYRTALETPAQREWDGDPWAVTFQGPNGTGKTWEATRTWKLVATQGALWLDGQTMAQRIRSSVKDGDSYDVLRRWADCPALLIDDLKAVRGTDFVAESLRYVLCQRYDWMRPTVLTLDLPLSELEPRLESRLVSGRVVLMDGKDRRRK